MAKQNDTVYNSYELQGEFHWAQLTEEQRQMSNTYQGNTTDYSDFGGFYKMTLVLEDNQVSKGGFVKDPTTGKETIIECKVKKDKHGNDMYNGRWCVELRKKHIYKNKEGVVLDFLPQGAPKVVDWDLNPLPEGILIGNGSKGSVIVSTSSSPTYKDTRLEGVQVVELVPFSKSAGQVATGSAKSLGFKPKEGGLVTNVEDDGVAFNVNEEGTL